ncbi:MAG: phosphatase PAP2 family protein [Traorella sp.]
MNEIISKKRILILFLVLIILMVLGSFFDYSISKAVFDTTSNFGKVLAAYGQAPVSLLISVAGIFLFKITDRKFSLKSIFAYLGGILLILFGVMMTTMEPIMYLGLSLPISFIISVSLAFIVNIIALILVKDCCKQQIKKAIQVILFVVIGQLLLVNIIKIPWGRPRMRMIATTEGASFQPWWIIGSNMKETLMAKGIASEEFKSFPSGHTASAACIFLICGLPLLDVKWMNKKTIFFIISCLFVALVGFSRIIMGAHFLTDITIGFACTLVVIELAVVLFRK